MSEIRCIENLNRLKEMLIAGEKGDAAYFSAKLNISRRTFFRLIKYIDSSNELKVSFNSMGRFYYLE